MSASLDPMELMAAVRSLAIDRLTAEIVGKFAEEGIESLVLKGPALAEWLYRDEVRPYGDSDLMVAPESWNQAVAVLNRLGFSDYLGPMAHPRMESFAGTCFIGKGKGIDLHCALHGLDGDMKEIWAFFLAGSERQLIGGAELRVPGRPALLLHIGLHAAHHAEGKALEDLRRAIALAGEEDWREAVNLARTHDGLPAFASGLRLLPEGATLAARLGIEQDVRSTRHEIRFERVPMAEGIDALLMSDMALRQRLAVVAREFFPRPEFLRWWSPLARRGRLGVIACYPWRWIWLFAHAPRGLLTWWLVRRDSGGQ
jgi:hypothetical protein